MSWVGAWVTGRPLPRSSLCNHGWVHALQAVHVGAGGGGGGWGGGVWGGGGGGGGPPQSTSHTAGIVTVLVTVLVTAALAAALTALLIRVSCMGS
jgi:hypothetical protein